MFISRQDSPNAALRRAFSKRRQYLRTVAFSLATLAIIASAGAYQGLLPGQDDLAAESDLRSLLSVEPAAGPATEVETSAASCPSSEKSPEKAESSTESCPQGQNR